MKKLEDTCSQNGRRYADSTGICAILLEKDDDAEQIIKQMTDNSKKAWYERTYSFNKEVESHIVNKYDADKHDWVGTEYKGRILLFSTRELYTD